MGEIVDFTSRLDATDALLEAVHGQVQTCRQAMILSRAAIGAGFLIAAAVFTVAPAYNTAPVVFGAFTAIIGGLVWLGANKSTMEELAARRAALEAEKADLFDHVAAQNGWAPDAIQTVH